MPAGGRHVVVLCDPQDARADAWQSAARASGVGSVQLLDYREALVGARGAAELAAKIPAGSVVRVDSPGSSWGVRVKMIERGLAGHPAELDPLDVRGLPVDDTRLLAFGPWWRGWGAFLREFEAGCERVPRVAWVAPVNDILAMGDKRACRRILCDRVAQPPALDDDGEHPRDLDELHAALARRGWHQAFVKLRYGAGAAGVVAFRWRGERCVGFTSLVASGAAAGQPLGNRVDTAFHHSSRVRRVDCPSALRRLVDWVLAEGVVVERWIPKRTWEPRGKASDGRSSTVDFRVVCVAGRARHVVVRQSGSPLTNLHLGNVRCAGDRFRRDDPLAHARVVEAAERAAGAFPRSLTAAVDVLVSGAGQRSRAWVVEVNSFGELLHGIADGGESPYALAWRAIQDGGTRGAI